MNELNLSECPLTYLSIIKSTLNLLMEENMNEDFFDFWYVFSDEVDLSKWQKELKLEAKIKYMYVILKTLNKRRQLTNKYINFLNTLESELTDYESENVLFNAFDNVLNFTVMGIPELFFTEKGYKYLNEEFHIADESLRKKAYHYVREEIEKFSVNDFCSKVGHSEFYFSVKLVQAILYLIKEEKLDYLITMTEYMEKDFPLLSKNTIIGLIYVYMWECKNKEELDFSMNAFDECIEDNYLKFFFNKDSITNDLTAFENTMLLLTYRKNKISMIENITNNWDSISSVLKSSDSKSAKEMKLKKFSGILK